MDIWSKRRRALIYAIILVCFGQWYTASGAPPAVVPIDNVREYEVFVKGKSAGHVYVRITESGGGTTIVSTEAEVTLDYVLYTYRYGFNGREVWHGNQLVSVDNRAEDGGKQLTVRAAVTSDGSTIETAGRSPVASGTLAMTTNYWRAPEVVKGRTFSLLDADQGTVHKVRVEGTTREILQIGDRRIDCTHYRLAGDLVADLWFDADGRLVRQQTTEDGRLVESQLVRITTKVEHSVRK